MDYIEDVKVLLDACSYLKQRNEQGDPQSRELKDHGRNTIPIIFIHVFLGFPW